MRSPRALTVLQERALLQIVDLPSVRIAEETCIRRGESNPSEVTVGRATADALLRVGLVEHASYRRVRVTATGRDLVARLTGGEAPESQDDRPRQDSDHDEACSSEA